MWTWLWTQWWPHWMSYVSNKKRLLSIISPSNHLLERKLVKIYNTWADANANNAFCSDDTSCIDVIAKCFNDTQHPTAKFCKCPYGYEVKNNNEKCGRIFRSKFCPWFDNYSTFVFQKKELIRISSLSPLNTVQSNYAECGVCNDKNAACIHAATQTTCWCQAGYKKENNQCGM